MASESFIQYLYKLYLKDLKSREDEKYILAVYLGYDEFKLRIKDNLHIK